MNEKEVAELLDKYLKGTCTPAEKALLESLYDEVLKKQAGDLQHVDHETAGASIFEKLPQPSSRPIGKLLRYAAAASVFIGIAAAGLLLTKKKPVQQVASVVQHDIAPGSNVATLTLSNGKKIALNDTAQKELATQAGIKIIKTNNGQLIYSVVANDAANSGNVGDAANSGNADNQQIGFNIAETPKGGQYKVQLADGTIVWLNAASSLKFPVRFTGKERVVELTGEAYFEVAHEATKPFIVKTVNENVLVLGTHFNVNAYHDEPVAITTLLEGRVKVQSAVSGNESMLKPGEQSLLSNDQLTVKTANLEEAVAWKNGYFRFNDEKIGNIMRKLERWYNIEEVRYEGKPSEELFNGKISRFKNISQVLRMLEKTESIHFKIDGRRVIVMP